MTTRRNRTQSWITCGYCDYKTRSFRSFAIPKLLMKWHRTTTHHH